jgi:hypothetical protein
MRRRTAAWGVVLAAMLAVGAWWWSAPPEPPARVRQARVTPAARPEGRTIGARRADPAPAPAPEEAPEPAAEEARCRVGEALAGWPIRLFLLSDGEPLDWRLEEGELVFAVPSESGEAGLTWGFYRRFSSGADSFSRIAWSGVGGPKPSCVVERLPAPLDAAVFGRVRGAERLPEGSVFLEGCGLQERGEPAPIDVDGGFFFQSQSGRCSVRAWRRSGLLRIPGPWVEVDASAGSDAEIDLEVPTYEPADMGILFGPTEGGVAVNGVHEGTPAAAAGLGEGDLITSIDGDPTDGMEVEDFLVHGVGPAGSEVQLEGITAEGEPFAITVTRAPIR